MVARTYCIERHENDPQEAPECPTCEGSGWDGDELCEPCEDTGLLFAQTPPEFEDRIEDVFPGRVQQITLSIDNCYYITVYTDPNFSQSEEMGMIERVHRSYD